MNYLIVTHEKDPTPMAATTKEELINFMNTKGKGIPFTLWEQNGVMIRKLGYYIGQ